LDEISNHKLASHGRAQWKEIAKEYGTQLDTYAKSVELAKGRSSIEQWLILVVAVRAITIFNNFLKTTEFSTNL